MRRYYNMQLKTLLHYQVSLPIRKWNTKFAMKKKKKKKLTFKFLYGGLSIL